jgi:hypothetical protein
MARIIGKGSKNVFIINQKPEIIPTLCERLHREFSVFDKARIVIKNNNRYFAVGQSQFAHFPDKVKMLLT